MPEISRSVLFGKLNRVLFTSLENATTFCKLRSNPYVELVHWLHQLMQQQDCDLQSVIRYFALDEAKLAKDIITALDRLPRGASAISDLSEHIDSAVERAWVYGSLKFGVDKIRTAHWLIGMLKTFNLYNTLKAISRQFEQVNADTLIDNFNAICGNSSEEPENEPPSHHSQPTKPQSSDSALRQYGQNLTDLARHGDIDPVSGRDEEIRQIVDILMRRRQNNPLLTGEAGVGKTAIIEGLALRIAANEVPPPLQNVQLWLLDIGMLQAGAGIKGEFESRLRRVIDEVQSSPLPIILFIDEIHTLIGAGGQQGTGDAANLLKPVLARGQLRTLGATTWSEYKKYIEKDPALTRRFQVVQIHEPDEAKALLMLRSLVWTLEKHHRVLLLDEAVEAAIRLSHRYIPARQLPDKAVALLDTACARVAISQNAEPPQLENCRHKIDALKIELEIVEREAKMGIGDQQRSNTILNALSLLEEQLIQLENRWQQELSLINRIIHLQTQLYAPSFHQQQHNDPNALHEELIALQQQLKTLQGEIPLIFASVDSNVVSAVVSDWTGVPLGRMVKDEINAVLHLVDTLNQRIIGQYHALELIAKRVRTSRAKLDDPNKPVGVFMLCGPSGVGKTETALALAETLYGGEQNLITINMSEFQEAHTVSTLKGAPPGYVGYGEGGVLTEAVRRRPYSVVLLDEIEKAHSDVHEIFFQVFDKGWMEDGEGRHIDFRNTIIILTSNIGADLVSSLCLQQAPLPDPEKLSTALRKPLLHVFPAALLGRLIVIPYYPLSDNVMTSIVHLQLARIKKRLLENHDIVATFDEPMIKYIVGRCTEIESGGRMVDAILTNSLLPQISQLLLSANANGQQYHQLQVSLGQGEFQFQFME
ncbi:putative ClpA/B-type chaperone (Putative ATPase with chaperone activity; probable component of SST VI cluster) [Xenorhabdus bovienii str. Jollieti]|uniref:Putative ClpA/B-type chaperone (Putative ATPase with chaperone activity probable component of SST VI cluster) n=1 Tax=Xenorhabdus bovienii (strain SS-2004) TaxID=406818 RepID=D3V3A7_XENBS|nr:type VI secretion system ATPase TssH [Xenorhabdus bovienii]CBJ81222.1 putative ClpA/B-type chaperone (Putative ATPase with chaperone activity; probable component of SST VI cluster) [Xenorhabdus bovienii SS-2004]CDH27023.1 putative ClpA/B-type chaperone (Putative ATPase with chaperone activity; probable component of SST VI cluster) [Xenorhabdus bovienii str. Jollieti]